MAVADNCIKWAWEALINYATYRVQGDSPGIQKVIPMPPDWDKTALPLLEDLWGSELQFDFEQHDYIMVRLQIGIQARDFPQDRWLGDLLTHCLYYQRPVGEFEICLPFQAQPVKLSSLGPNACRNAHYAVGRLLRSVAKAKSQQIEKTEKIA